MTKQKFSLSKRLSAVVLAVLMVFSTLSATTVFAATAQHPDTVTITVMDEQGKPVEGAEVTFTIDSVANGDSWKQGVEITDSDGVVEVLSTSEFVKDDLTITASISKDKFETNDVTIVDSAIASGDQNFDVQLISTEIDDVTIEGKNLTYNGSEQELVSVTEVAGDTVSYESVEGEYTLNNGKPVATDAGTYKIQVTVSRAGKDDLVETVTTIINPANIAVDFTERLPGYNETEQELVTVTGEENIPEGSIVTWYLNNEEYSSDIQAVPAATAVGEYTVRLVIDGNPNYATFDLTKKAHITKGKLDLEGLTVEGLSGTYKVDENGDPVAQEAVKVTPESGYSYTLKYQLDDGDLTVDDNAWTEDIPTVTNAGSYIVWVKAVKDGYNDSDVPVNPAAGAVAPYNVYIEKAEQSLQFINQIPTEVTVDETNPEKNVYDFSVAGDNLSGKDVQYSLVDASSDGVASISADGQLTVAKAGIVTVKAVREGNDNYHTVNIYATVIVKVSDNGLISFDKNTVDYVLDESGIVSKETAKKENTDDNGSLAYSIDNTNVGLSIVSETGEVTISNRNKLAKAMGHSGNITVTVTVEKAAGTVTAYKWVKDGSDWARKPVTEEVYPSVSTSYTLFVTYATAPEFEAVCQITDPAATGWYNAENPAVVSPIDTEKYSVALDSPEGFAAEQTISAQGTKAHYIYIKDKTTKQISAGIEINIKIDTENARDLKVEYAKSPLDEFLEVITLGFYNPSVTLRFTATDDISGLDYLDWTYTREAGQSETNLETETGTLTFVDGKAELTLTASEEKQYRGNISFTVYDKAGNSTSATDDGNVFVVDTISPTMKAAFEAADSENSRHEEVEIDGKTHHFFNGKVDFKFTINEANFFEEDVAIKLTKDGQEVENLDVKWSVDETNGDIHYADFSFEGDGDYVVEMVYRNGKGDNSGNVMVDFDDLNKKIEKYVSDVITIDSTDAKLGPYNLVRDENMDSTEMDSQKTVFRVEERNFDPSYFTVTSAYEGASEIARDIKGNPVSTYDLQEALRDPKNWEKGEKTYEYIFETSHYTDGIYNFVVTYNDNVTEPTKVTANFTVDHTAPTDVKIEYSQSILDTVLDTVLEAVTLGFYNPSVKVTFTAFDTSAGVESFTWNYTKQKDQSEVNRPTDDEEKIKNQVIPAVQDEENKSKFTAEVVLPETEAEQLRGCISVLATDTYSNASDKITDDDYVIVVDTISPTMTAEYSKEARKVGTTAYYNGDATVTFTVNEANFFAEDVKVTVTKDGGIPYAITPSWIDESADVHVGTYTLSGDGDYVIHVAYIDRSANEMDSYTSHVITIDTVAPVIDVKYTNEKCINKLSDNEGNEREYFDDTQTAVVTITEHNFNAEKVDFSIIAKDVTGKQLDADALHEKSTWKVDSTGDVHTITLTYPGDANYTFDIAYSDLATNKAADYVEDYFTVDKTDAVNLSVNYSTSVLDTVLESLSFGFYNAKMKVTITAKDSISGVHSFLYSYKNAAGVSSVNAELINQKIEASDIKYSESGERATATFEIPKMILGSDNQFNGTVEFTATDRCGNESNPLRDAKRIVVDNIAPNAQVSYNEATNVIGDISYYNGDINATVTINEANFYADDVQVMVSKDGGNATAVAPSWSNNSVDVHVGTFTLTEDGDYIVTINYKDKSSNSMATYSSNQMTIDTKIDVPTYTVNGVPKLEEGGAYKGDATIGFNFEDQNFASNTIKLTRTRFNSVEDVTDEFINVSTQEKGGGGTFTIPSEVGNDGIYILSIGMTDKANHTTESQMKFTINRYGSVYEYGDYLTSLIKDGGQYVKIEEGNESAITQDLIITEYNANQILTDSLNILITRDGEAIDAKYTANPTVDSNAGIGESGWYQYVYTIDQKNFEQDGVYKITLSSAYSASDSEKNDSTSVPDNSIDTAGNQILDTISFTVDTTAPEIRNVVNLDKEIVNAQSLDVDYTLVDVGGLKSVEIIVDGSTLDTVTEFGDNAFNYSGKFMINESSESQTVQIKVTDIAGNVTDTASDDFSTNDLYIFNDVVIVSTNFFVRWYANKPLFWSSIGGVVVVAAAICVIAAYKRKKNENTTK